MRARIRRILAQYGQTVTVKTAAGETETKAFLQPVTERSEEERGAATELGWVDLRRWRYLGQTAVEPGDTVIWQGGRFRVCSSRAYAAGETVLYWWAALEREKETV